MRNYFKISLKNLIYISFILLIIFGSCCNNFKHISAHNKPTKYALESRKTSKKQTRKIQRKKARLKSIKQKKLKQKKLKQKKLKQKKLRQKKLRQQRLKKAKKKRQQRIKKKKLAIEKKTKKAVKSLPNMISIYVGEERDIVVNSPKKVKVTCGDESIINLKKTNTTYNIIGIKEGETVVTVKSGKNSKKIKIKILEKEIVSSSKFSNGDKGWNGNSGNNTEQIKTEEKILLPEMTHFIAHRGLAVKEIENSMSAFKEAIKADFWGIETDINVTKDGVFVLSHDGNIWSNKTIEKPTDLADEAEIKGDIKDLDYEQVKRLSNGIIPKLEEFLELIKPWDIVPLLEIKNLYAPDTTLKKEINNYFNTNPELNELVKEELASYDMAEKVVSNEASNNESNSSETDNNKSGINSRERRKFIEENKQIIYQTEKLLELIDKYGLKDRCYITSFDKKNIEEVRRVDKDIKIQFITTDSNVDYDYLIQNNFGIDLEFKSSTDEIVKKLRENNINVCLWVIDDVDAAFKAIERGTCCITTNKKIFS